MNKFIIHDFDMNDVIQRGHNLFVARDGKKIEIDEPENVNIKQGFLEGSNVSIVKEMIEMIAIQRHYQANEKAIKTQDEALGKAASQIAR